MDGIIRIVSGVINLLATLATRLNAGSVYTWITPFTGLILALIGFLLIVLSRAIADIMFRDE